MCDGDADHGVDALFLTPETGADSFERLTIYQSKYTQSATQIGENDVKHLIATANHFRTLEGLKALLATTIEPRLAGLIDGFLLVRKLRDGWVDTGRLQIDLVLVSTGFMGPGALAEVDAANRAEGRDFVSAWDIDRIGPIAAAVASVTCCLIRSLRTFLPVMCWFWELQAPRWESLPSAPTRSLRGRES